MNEIPSYSVITPVRDEARNLPRLAASMRSQTVRPVSWLIVDNGSTDGTLDLARGLEREANWITVLELEGAQKPGREAAIGRAMAEAVARLSNPASLLIKADADVTFGPNYFEEVLKAFEQDTRLGIASGAGYERQDDGTWRQRHPTGSFVWGACRAYRWECLNELLPLDERVGWDGIDVMKAENRGWAVRVLEGIPFRHHRAEGSRDGPPSRTWLAEGRLAHYLGYRPTYLVLRAIFRAREDSRALFIPLGYAEAALRRMPRCSDSEVRLYVRRHQSLRNLTKRAREARRPRGALQDSTGR